MKDNEARRRLDILCEDLAKNKRWKILPCPKCEHQTLQYPEPNEGNALCISDATSNSVIHLSSTKEDYRRCTGCGELICHSRKNTHEIVKDRG